MYLIDIWQMFNAAIDDLAMKPYIPHKNNASAQSA